MPRGPAVNTRAKAMIDADDLIAHMRRVQGAERDMRDLGLAWQMIESGAAISCPQQVQSILPTLSQTRERFDDLQRRLVARLVDENLAALKDELSARAQCAIDILVRNLFERTADVGFLATDDVVREFCAADDAGRAGSRAALQARLAEYRAKYSVYQDVIVLDPHGQVLVRLDSAAQLATSADPIVRHALQQPGYVEHFGASDLAADGAAALLYAHRIDDGHGRALGVLVLRFRFEDELARIFASVDNHRHGLALLLLDDQQRVLASNDIGHVALGVTLRAVPDGEVALTTYGGREYLAIRCAARPYQGYAGPRWRMQAMVSLLTAFRGRDDSCTHQHVSLDNAELSAVQSEADAINRNLRRVVWNGRLKASQRTETAAAAAAASEGDLLRLKAVLSQINGAGARIRARVGDAVDDLHRTSLSRMCQQSVELARLAADIMDRNLYERANDCRWWALSPAIGRALADADGARGTQRLNALLDHINDLYTVYTRLVAFDLAGTVRGTSRERDEGPLVGSAVDPHLTQWISGLTDSQRYAVSPFAPSPLADNQPTYLYVAAIRDQDSGRVIGGIAVAFNALHEFGAMLRDVLGERVGVAAFVDEHARVLCATDSAWTTGTTVPLATDAAITSHDGAHWAVARVAGSGYREFKSSDGYRNGVSAVIALRLGPVDQRVTTSLDVTGVTVNDLAHSRGQRSGMREYALAQVGASHYALPAEAVLEAVAPRALVRAPNAHPHVRGLIEVQHAGRSHVIQVISARALLGLPTKSRATDGVAVVIRSPHQADKPALALWVDDVMTVFEADPLQVQEAPASVRQHSPLVTGMLSVNLLSSATKHAALVQLLSPEALVALVTAAARAGLANSADDADAVRALAA